MDLIRVESKEELKSLLNSGKITAKNTEIVLVSGVIKFKAIPEEFICHDYRVLIPSAAIINEYIECGFDDEYLDSYNKYLSKPDVQFFINELIYRMFVYEVNIVLVCAKDEQEFKYLKLIGKMIDRLYGITMLNFKKFKESKHSKMNHSDSYYIELTENRRKVLNDKLKDCGIELPFSLNRRVTKKDIKSVPKKYRKKFKSLLGIDN